MKLNEPQRNQVDTLRSCRARIAELKALADLAQAQLAEALGDHDTGEDPDGKIIITYKTHKARRLNQKGLREQNPAVVELYTETTEYRRMELP
jgi:predicted phage-related endonuclease